jgi:hypothetical protein
MGGALAESDAELLVRAPLMSVVGDMGKRTTTSAAISRRITDTSSRFIVPSRSASTAVTPDPVIDPSVPPTPMKPNSRFACSLRKTSAMKHQKTDVMKRLKTLVQT